MKLSTLAISIAITAFFAGTVSAQDGLIQPVTVSDSTGYTTYIAQDDASAKPADAPAAVQKSCGCDKSSGCDKGCGGGCRRGILGRHLDSICTDCEHDCPDRDPWRLFGCHNENNCHNFSVTGWISAGYTATEGEPSDGSNGTVHFNDLADEAVFNQVYFQMEKTTDTSERCWDLGGRLDLGWGRDFHEDNNVTGFALDDGVNNGSWDTSSIYGWKMPQAYLDLAYGDTNTKMGRYYTIIGYEVVTAPDNFFYSRSLSFFYAEPFTHTGVLATIPYNDNFTFALGVDRGWDTWEDPNNDLSVTGGIFWTSCDERTTIAMAGTYGDEFSSFGGNSKRTMGSFVLTREITGKLQYILQSDGIYQDGKNGAIDEEVITLNQYLIYQMNCCWSSGIRFEIFNDDDGARIAESATDEAVYYELTMGLNWQATDNLKVRPELRWDWADGKHGGTVLPYDGGTDDKQITGAIDVVWLW